jgi:NADPH:quinone reductase-like Zn-dependent oxidoreductase
VRHDVLIDIAGSRSFRKLRRVLTPEATIVIVGAHFPANKGLGPLGHVIRMRLGGLVRSQKVKFFITKITKEDLAVLQELLESGKVKSVVDKTYELSQVDDALRYLGEGHARGKIVITM